MINKAINTIEVFIDICKTMFIVLCGTRRLAIVYNAIILTRIRFYK